MTMQYNAGFLLNQLQYLADYKERTDYFRKCHILEPQSQQLPIL